MICKICVKHTSLFILGAFFWGFIENSVNFFRGAHEKPIYRRGEGRGGGEKGEAGRGKGGGGEGRGVDNGMHTMLSPTISLLFCY